ncbi:MAG: hypothetical protein WBC44_15200 [Planctomycetaceae bacterium]
MSDPQERARIATPAGVVTLRDGESALIDSAYRVRVKFLRGRGQRVELEIVAVPPPAASNGGSAGGEANGEVAAVATPKPYLSREGRA